MHRPPLFSNLFPYTTLFRSVRKVVGTRGQFRLALRLTIMSCLVSPMMLPEIKVQKRIMRSEEHTSELQSRGHLVCRLLLEKKIQNLGLLVLLYTRSTSQYEG